MRPLAVLAKRLAVVGDDDDCGGYGEAQLPEAIEKPSDSGVGICHFTVVRRVARESCPHLPILR